MDRKAENIIIISQLLAGLPQWKEGVRRRGEKIEGWRRREEMGFN